MDLHRTTQTYFRDPDSILTSAPTWNTNVENQVVSHLDAIAAHIEQTNASVDQLNVAAMSRVKRGFFSFIGKLVVKVVLKVVGDLVSKWLSSLIGINIKITLSTTKIDVALGKNVNSLERVAPGTAQEVSYG